ncbi:hypothetical protein PGSY75_1218100 [Plasmodium gaboni]|uniref:Uncharacterized protein n=1 Tax=Plasmodium gaboni TaxID=647221 RepID=A0A151LGC1_9APIC|nr:hypothetical protein PGSY75_1218100 [Plasmodium gaboni]KYN97992.1 hypothetical protein PGSY75_1218100 [Plasmodium gaboni]
MNMNYYNKYKKFRLIHFCLIFFSYCLIVQVIYCLKIKTSYKHEALLLLKSDDEPIISLNKMIPYLSEEVSISKDNIMTKINVENNICIELIKKHENINMPIEKFFHFNNREYTIDIGNNNNIYNYTKRILNNKIDFELCNKILIFIIPFNKDMCSFTSYNNYFLYINYLKDVKIELILSALEKSKFVFLKIPKIFNLNTTNANFNDNDYIIEKGILENDLIKIDITKIIQRYICKKYSLYKSDEEINDDDNNDNNNNDNLGQTKNNNSNNDISEKEIKMVLMTSHTLSDIIIFPSLLQNVQSLKHYKNIKNVVKLKKKIKKRYTEWENWSPCYNVCNNNFSYKCRYYKCPTENKEFCDQNFHMNFSECPFTPCEDPIKQEEGKKEEQKDKNKSIIINHENNRDQEGPIDDETMLRYRKNKKISFFMWIINNKKLSLGLLIFFISVIVLTCIYCYINSTLGFYNDEEYYVSKYT